MFGFEETEISANLEEWDKRVHPDDKEKVYQDINKHLSGENEIYENEHRVLCKDNTYKWILDRGKIMSYTPDNKPERMIGTHSDISGRKQRELQIKKLSIAVEQSANTIVITDIEGSIEYTNPKFTQITGYSKEEAFGENPGILNAGTQSKEYYKKMWETILSGNIWRGEFHNKSKKGEFFWEQVTITPIKNESDKIINFLAIKEDVTAKKIAEDELLASRDKYKTIFENAATSIILVDRKGIITYINKYHIENIARRKASAKDYIGRSIITHPSIVAAGLGSEYKKVLQGEKITIKSVYFPTSTAGTDLYLNIKGVPILKNNKVN